MLASGHFQEARSIYLGIRCGVIYFTLGLLYYIPVIEGGLSLSFLKL